MPRRLELVVHLDSEERTYPLPDHGVLTVGRAPECDIRVEHRSVSRFHLLLHLDSGVAVEDRGSANGTVLHRESERAAGQDEVTGGRQQSQHLPSGVRTPIELGTVIQVGAVMLTVRQQASAATSLVRGKRDGDKLGPAVLLDPGMRELYNLAVRAARGDITVLILGETGSGKEILAETIHHRSRRSAGPFLRLNCAAFGESLLESELFGYEKGAFTGATQSRVGLLESSNGGTVFLDEIGELPLSIQAKLLRVLEERTIRPVGSNKTRTVDVRFVTATNRDLRREIRRGTFREDLYFRISGVHFEIPPLRRRPSEILPLAEFFLSRYCNACGLAVPRLAEDARQRLLGYTWPGNVRELRSAIERAVFLSPDGLIHADNLLIDHALDVDWMRDAAEDEDSTRDFDPPTDVRMPAVIPPRIEHSGAGRRTSGAGFEAGLPSRRGQAAPSDSGSPYSGGPYSNGSQGVGPHSGGPYSGGSHAGNHWAQGAGGRNPDAEEQSSGVEAEPPSAPEGERERILWALECCAGNQTRAAALLGISRRTLVTRLDTYAIQRPRKRT